MLTTPTRSIIAALAALAPQAALASLGGTVDTIGTDQARMHVRSRADAAVGAGARHTLTLANGGEIREYTNAAGVVYAVRWMGPGKPDLASLLGVHYAAFQADNPITARHGLRRPPRVSRANLRIITGGRPGAFWGYAWLPQSAPARFDPASL